MFVSKCFNRNTVYLLYVIGASVRESHSNMENGMMIHAQKIVAKNGSATQYCSLVQWFVYKET